MRCFEFPGVGFPSVPAFEFYVPDGMEPAEQPNCLGSLLARPDDGFAPNIVVGFDRVGADITLTDVTTQLRSDFRGRPNTQVGDERSIDTQRGEARLIAKTFEDERAPERLFQLTGCMFSPRDGGATRDLVYLTGTCTVEQSDTWEPIFTSAISSLRFL